MIQTLGVAAKAILREEFIVTKAYLRKQEKSQINNLTLYLKQLEKEEQTKPKVCTIHVAPNGIISFFFVAQ